MEPPEKQLNRRWTPMDADERGILVGFAKEIIARCRQAPGIHEFALTIGVHRRPSAVNLPLGLLRSLVGGSS
jgi:hypothetical protein